MKINLTNKEYRILLDLLEMARWMIDSYKSEPEPEDKEHIRVCNKLLSFAEKFGFGNLVEYVEDVKEYCGTREFEDTTAARKFINDYDEDNFWTELAIHLADRDLLRREGIEKLQQMSAEDTMMKFWTLEGTYLEELSEHGLEHVEVKDFKWPEDYPE